MGVFDFRTQLDYSYSGVSRIIDWLYAADGGFWGDGQLEEVYDVQDIPDLHHQGDIAFVFQGELQYMEVKVESRTSLATPNLAVEVYSDFDRKKLGGPIITRADWYCHLYNDGLLWVAHRYFFSMWCVSQVGNFRFFYAQNKGWRSQGMLIPRASVPTSLNCYELWID